MARSRSRPAFGSGTEKNGFYRGVGISGRRLEGRRSRSKIRKDLAPNGTSLISFPLLSGSNAELNGKEGGEANRLLGWKSLFLEPKKIMKDRVLSFYKPLPHGPDEIPVVVVSKEAVSRETKIWEKCLVGYVVGKRPMFKALRDKLSLQWRLSGEFRMHSLSGGFFLFNFNDNSDRNRVLLEGPWNFYGRPMVLKEWHLDMDLRKEHFNSLPIWIRLPGLDLRFWDVESIGKISSVIGHPRLVDEATANRERLTFARACVEITPSCEFPTRVNILHGTKRKEQAIHYEWCPPCCKKCNSFEHDESFCKRGQEKADDNPNNHINLDPEEDIGEWQTMDRRKKGGLNEIRSENVPKLNLNQPEKVWTEKTLALNEPNENANTYSLLEKDGHAEEEDADAAELNKELLKDDGPISKSLEQQGNNTNGKGEVDPKKASQSSVGKGNVLLGDIYNHNEPEILSSIADRDLEKDLEDGQCSNSDSCEETEPCTPSRVCETPENANLSEGKVDGSCAACNTVVCSEDFNQSLDFPPGFTPTRDELLDLRSMIKEGASMIPVEYQSEFLESVDNATDEEILAFVNEKMSDPKPGTNFNMHQGIRRSPRIKKRTEKLMDSISSSGLKKGFLK